MAEYRNQNFIFTLCMILLAFEKKNSFILFWSAGVRWCWYVYTPARAASDDAVLASDDY